MWVLAQPFLVNNFYFLFIFIKVTHWSERHFKLRYVWKYQFDKIELFSFMDLTILVNIYKFLEKYTYKVTNIPKFELESSWLIRAVSYCVQKYWRPYRCYKSCGTLLHTIFSTLKTLDKRQLHFQPYSRHNLILGVVFNLISATSCSQRIHFFSQMWQPLTEQRKHPLSSFTLRPTIRCFIDVIHRLFHCPLIPVVRSAQNFTSS